MDPAAQHLCLQYIANEWRTLRPRVIGDNPPVSPPWAVWIRLYRPIPGNLSPLGDPEPVPWRLWLLTSRGIEARNPWEYARFITVISKKPWSITSRKPSEPGWGRRYHEIALAGFAELIEEEKIYLEFQWGGTLGRGYHAVVDEQGKLQLKTSVWIS